MAVPSMASIQFIAQLTISLVCVAVSDIHGSASLNSTIATAWCVATRMGYDIMYAVAPWKRDFVPP